MESIIRSKVQEAIDSGAFKSLNALARKAGVDPAGLSRFMKNEGGESKTTLSFASKIVSALGGRLEFDGNAAPSIEDTQKRSREFVYDAWERAVAELGRKSLQERQDRLDRMEESIRQIQAVLLHSLDKYDRDHSE